MMKKALLFALTLTLWLGLTAALGYAQKPHGTSPVSLKVTIESFDSSGNPCKVTADGAGPYVDGQDGVAASFDNTGNLIINFQSGKTVQRAVTFDYSSPYTGFDSAPPQSPHTPVSGSYPRAYLSTIPQSNDGSYILLQNLAIGARECVRLSWTYTLNDANKTQWRHNFQRTSSTDGLDIAETSYAVVTRVDANTWVVEPAANASCNSSVPAPALARIKDTPTVGSLQLNNDGLYYLPFKLTLVRK